LFSIEIMVLNIHVASGAICAFIGAEQLGDCFEREIAHSALTECLLIFAAWALFSGKMA
jgi:hypothetical protein